MTWRALPLPDDLSPSSRESALNVRVQTGLNGDHAHLRQSLLELLRSDVPIHPATRHMLADAIEYEESGIPAIRFTGIGPKSEAGLISQRRYWLDLAEDFAASGLSQPAYLEAGRFGIDQRSRKLLQDAIAFQKQLERFCKTKKTGVEAVLEFAGSGADEAHIKKAFFCEYVVQRGLLSVSSIRDFLQEG